MEVNAMSSEVMKQNVCVCVCALTKASQMSVLSGCRAAASLYTCRASS